MMPRKKLSLKEARKQGKLDEFVKDREKGPKGDKDKFDKTLDSMTHPSGHQEKSKSTQETSSQDSSEN